MLNKKNNNWEANIDKREKKEISSIYISYI